MALEETLREAAAALRAVAPVCSTIPENLFQLARLRWELHKVAQNLDPATLGRVARALGREPVIGPAFRARPSLLSPDESAVAVNLVVAARALIVGTCLSDDVEGVLRGARELVQSNRCAGEVVVVLTGVSAATAADLGEGVSLKPMDEVPPLMGGGPLKSLSDGATGLFGGVAATVGAALVRPVDVHPALAPPRHPGGISLAVMREDLLGELGPAARCVSLATDGAAEALGHWGERTDARLLIPPLGAGFEWHENAFFRGRREAVRADIGRIRLALRAYREFRGDTAALNLAIERLVRSRRARATADRALDLGVALEVLLRHVPGSPRKRDSDITRKLASRAGWLLAADGEDEAVVKLRINKLYELRNDAAHFGSVRRRTALDGREVSTEEALDSGASLCARLMLAVLKAGDWPQWPGRL
jgi:hypothetical protein